MQKNEGYMLKLPKNISTHPNIKAIETLFTKNLHLLHQDGKVKVPHMSFNENVRNALKSIYASKHLIQGLEAIGSHLDKELKGLKALAKKSGETQNDRLSRLLILSNDGSERFYHNAESILNRHSSRSMAIIIEASSEELGEAFTKKSNPAKALLIDERKSLEAFLSAIAETL